MSAILKVLVCVCAYIAVAVIIGYRLKAVHKALFDFVRGKPATKDLGPCRVLGLDDSLNLVPNPGVSVHRREDREETPSLGKVCPTGNPRDHAPSARCPGPQSVNVVAVALNEEAVAGFRAKRILAPFTGSLGLISGLT
ncbi:MAG: hypothetical protein N2255_02375, partial [Kiritimatiellae bacterium]|nr:hypothetical protein [Kiritimatiellia bacterium]